MRDLGRVRRCRAALNPEVRVEVVLVRVPTDLGAATRQHRRGREGSSRGAAVPGKVQGSAVGEADRVLDVGQRPRRRRRPPVLYVRVAEPAGEGETSRQRGGRLASVVGLGPVGRAAVGDPGARGRRAVEHLVAVGIRAVLAEVGDARPQRGGVVSTVTIAGGRPVGVLVQLRIGQGSEAGVVEPVADLLGSGVDGRVVVIAVGRWAARRRSVPVDVGLQIGRIAVLVDAVAGDLGRPGEDCRLGVVAVVDAQGRAVAVDVRLEVGPVAVLVRSVAGDLGRARPGEVVLVVAVVVSLRLAGVAAVAILCQEWGCRTEAVAVAVLPAGDCVEAVAVLVDPVVYRLRRSGVRRRIRVVAVAGVGVAVAVVIVVNAVGLLVVIEVWELIDHRAVAVGVNRVALLSCPWVDRGIAVVAVPRCG